MSEEKRNRITAAVTVNVILLIFILVAVLIYQFVVIVQKNNMRNQYIGDIKSYEQKIEQTEDDLEYLQSYEGLLDYAMQQGYDFGK